MVYSAYTRIFTHIEGLGNILSFLVGRDGKILLMIPLEFFFEGYPLYMSSYLERVYPTQPQLTTPEGGKGATGKPGYGNQGPIRRGAYSIRDLSVRLRTNY